MWEKIKKFFKKAWAWFAAALGVIGAALLVRSIGQRLAANRAELGRLRDEIGKSTEELQRLRAEQSIAADAGAELEKSLREQSGILDDVEGKLREDAAVLDESELQLGEAKRLITETRRIMEKYSESTDVVKNR